jgi:exopolyphosphatase / guanosine-5'-triphosphate,3'-diphosphate pyrophosphatase
MKLAAIDIGSNAVRLQITKVIEYEHVITFKKLEYVRFPLRLGHDVFSTGRISEFNQDRFFKLMIAYKNLIDLYEINAFYGCATSAMRESENGQEILDKVNAELSLPISIISGEQEAEIINNVILLSLDNDHYVHIDVGGGSTELNVYENHQKLYSHSFKLGSVRSLEGRDKAEDWEEMRGWVKKYAFKKGEKITAIGTGGNINKLFELSTAPKKPRRMGLETLTKIQDVLKNLTLEERINKLQLNPDRADVIVPASDIYTEVMKAAKAKTIVVPDIGLKDGINYHLYQMHHPTSDKIFVKN